MSKETSEWLNRNTLIGFTSQRGNAWHYRASDQGNESNHYPGPIPINDVVRRLFHWKPVEATAQATYLTDAGFRTLADPSSKAIVRPDTNTVLGFVGKDYKIHDHQEWLLTKIGTFLDADLAIGSAGLLKNGAVAWVQVEMPETCTTPEGMKYRPFLSGATSLDQSMSTTYTVGAQVIVCDNTLSAALLDRSSRQIKIRHTSRSVKVNKVREALGILHQAADDFGTQVKALYSIDVTDHAWSKFLNAYAPLPTDVTHGRSYSLAQTKRNHLNQLWKHDPRVTPWRHTALGVVQAVNTYTTHLKTVRNVSRPERNMQRAVTGKTDDLDRTTLAILDRVLDGALTH